MGRYQEIAERYSSVANELWSIVSKLADEFCDIGGDVTDAELMEAELTAKDVKQRTAEAIARLVNAGVVSCPRGVQGTVRLNIVNGVCKDLPIRCSLEEKLKDPERPEMGSYKALVVKHL